MQKWRVTLSGPPMRFGGLGTAATGWSTRVDADTRGEAVEIARAECRDTFDGSYASGRARCVELHMYAVTLRKRDDKRKHDTFMTWAEDEREALTNIAHLPAAYRWSGMVYRPKPNDPRVVRVEMLA